MVDQDSRSVIALAKRPSAFFALAMSVAALAVVLGNVAMNGGHIQSADEGAAAHIWQLLMAAQVPAAAWFAIKWLPKARRPAQLVLAMLAGTTLANLAAVFFLT